ncbi:MAG: hypothetical protein M3P18_16455, partial [Actinomycetota bacterium]|nr:hypothetical protein [Actinomycetota bacterium]
YTAVAGLILLGLGWLAVERSSAAAAATLFVLGGGALITAPFVSRLEGTLRIGPVELTLRQQVLTAVRHASDDSLEGVLPLLTSDDVSVATLRVPDRFEGLRLTDDELGFLRKKLNVSVLGIMRPGAERWRAGGEASELELHGDDQLLVAGHPDVLSYLRFLIASDDDDLWMHVL